MSAEGNARSVLVVDDDHAVRSLISVTLTGHGYEVALASNGRAGVERFKADPGRFRIVLLDYHMPEMDGITASRAIREHRPDAAVILMSSENIPVNFRTTGIREFLPKPFAKETLLELVNRNLGPEA